MNISLSPYSRANGAILERGQLAPVLVEVVSLIKNELVLEGKRPLGLNFLIKIPKLNL
jgi:hypothetical protein